MNLSTTAGATMRAHLTLLAVSASLSFPISKAQADFSLVYHVTSATVVLFNQPQPSPFANVEARLFIHGQRARLEARDLWGRTHVWICDRQSHTTWQLLENNRYTVEPNGWSCQNFAAQVAELIAVGFAKGGLDSLTITGGKESTWQGTPARTTQWAFRARVFGMPKPVWVSGDVYFPMQEQTRFGAASSEVYCGARPGVAEWQKAFEHYLPVSASGSQVLAGAASLPVALDFKTELELGSATLRLEASDPSNRVLADSLFQIPQGYLPLSTTE